MPPYSPYNARPECKKVQVNFTVGQFRSKLNINDLPRSFQIISNKEISSDVFYNCSAM